MGGRRVPLDQRAAAVDHRRRPAPQRPPEKAPSRRTGVRRFDGASVGRCRFCKTPGSAPDSSVPRKEAPVQQNLPCNLEDLYKGTTKKMKISREIADSSGKRIVQEILTIEIKPGWKKGTKITFQEKGNEQPGVIPADLVFIIDEKPHKVFSRDGNDLIVTQKIPLAEALTGTTVQLTTLDGRNLTIPINNVIQPNYEHIVPGEGMPLPKDPSKKGNLRIKFDIKFPARLTVAQKSGIKELLGS